MSFRHFVQKNFNNHAESRDEHWNKTLQTKYYKTTKDKAMESLISLFERSEKYNLNAVSKEHGEISVTIKKGKKAFIVATVIMVRPYQTAIDFSVTTESIIPFDFGYSTKVIHHLYELVGRDLQVLDKR
ncbi:cytosolic protein [Ornithinibacillus gellani]|uniref:cytosolic protein n=1 Tax=Ornithinibacillus gellani TaxID=2293253 RepID=UPI000F460072|nr:cytosolic protein [Ornithinibacillus gellani]TQS76235.1 cytosolic protein [Ornithinibacillus gellani]